MESKKSEMIVMDSKTKIKVKSSTAKSNLNEFLNKHYINRDDGLPMTNTKIGSKTNSGGSYHIPDEEYDQFLDLYYKDVIKKGADSFLTEKQRDIDGPIAIDIDLRYNYDVDSKQYTKDHIDDLIDLYLEELKKIFQFDENTNFNIFIFEKSSVNRISEKQITKDGIHMIIGIQADRIIQNILRSRIIEQVSEAWEDLPITNTWEDVFDKGISEGVINWQLYGSKKPNHEPYKVTYIYNVTFDESDGEMMRSSVTIEQFDIDKNFKQLSVRYNKHPFYFMKNDFIEIYNEQSNKTSVSKMKTITSKKNILNCSENIDILSIRNHTELDQAVNAFLDSITPTEYELKETYEYTMTLPESYYGAGSYLRWMRVGWALRNISDKLLIVWIAFSAKSPEFRFDSIRDDLYNRWIKFDMNNPNGLTKRSIMHWSKQDAFEGYTRVRTNSIDYYIDLTLDSMHVNSIQDSKNSKKSSSQVSGCGDFDIATVLYHLFKDEFVCVSVKQNIWYRYKYHRWIKNESGTSLRLAISKELCTVYHNKANKLITLAASMSSDDEKYTILRDRASRILDICVKLRRTHDKDNIMKEARDIFRDETFLDRMDMNTHLLGFKNGVIDFKETDYNKIFRRGYPEDCITKCTNIDYIHINPAVHGPIISEIKDFMRQLFPIKEIHDYMWEHLAATLIGEQKEECFNMYIGKGRNGKSKLVDLMGLILGDYKGDVPLSLVTEKRGKVGGLAPEIVNLKGIRYAVMQEPSKGDRINDGAMKWLTGGDVVEGRGLYSEHTTKFVPQFKLVVCSNQFMEIKTQDDGTWRRIRVIDFVSKFTEDPVEGDPEYPYQFPVDLNIKEKFIQWKEVFMSMLVDIAYEKQGIVQVPEKIKVSSKAYKESQDYIAEFIRDKIIIDDNGKIKKNELNSEFSIWYMSTYGRGGPPPKDVHAYMDKVYGKYDKKGAWIGVKIKYERDETDNNDDLTDDISSNDL